MPKWIKALLFVLWLEPLIARDYALRAKGKRPDRMYWADSMALSLGMLDWYDAPNNDCSRLYLSGR